MTQAQWRARAAEAETAVVGRHLRALVPGAALGVVGWPARVPDRLFLRWHYWWQAHLVDCLVDAQLREPLPARERQIRRLTRGIWLRNGFRWTNSFHDDIAWLGLALQRAQDRGMIASSRALPRIVHRLRAAWAPDRGGGLPWRVGSSYFNTPANGPAGILLARNGSVDRADQTWDWLRRTLLDPGTGLLNDGIDLGAGGAAGAGAARPNPDRWSYCQGVGIGLALELRQGSAAAELVLAVARELAEDGVLRTEGGGNAGLFAGIAVRYLALAATTLDVEPDDGTGTVTSVTDLKSSAAVQARMLVLHTAEALWAGRVTAEEGPLFPADRTRRAGGVSRRGAGRYRRDGAEASVQPERDLSVQLAAWMILEAAASLPDVPPARHLGAEKPSGG